MDCFLYIISIYKTFINITEDLQIEAIDTLNNYGGV